MLWGQTCSLSKRHHEGRGGEDQPPERRFCPSFHMTFQTHSGPRSLCIHWDSLEEQTNPLPVNIAIPGQL